jgi:translation initiation factor 3 subunit K
MDRYQFNPHLANPEMIIHILIKALSSSVGGPDFTVCLPFLREPAAIIRDAESEDASLVTVLPWLQEINGLIRTCKFAEFWSAWNGSSEGAQGELQLLGSNLLRLER